MTKFKLVSVLPALCASWMLTGCPDDTSEGNDDNNNDSSSSEDTNDPDTTVSGVTLSTTDSDPSSSTDPSTTMTTVDPDSSSSGDPTDATESSSSSADGSSSSDSGSDSSSSTDPTAGTESSSSGDPSAGTESSESGIVPMDSYNDCANSPKNVCEDEEQTCLFVGSDAFCSPGCVTDADCPAGGSGDATPTCIDIGDPTLYCTLDCSNGEDCPTGMFCGEGVGACLFEFVPVAPGGGVCPDSALGAAPVSYDGDAEGLFDDYIPSCAGGGGGEEELLDFTAGAAGSYTFSTDGSPTDTVVFVLGGCDGPELACNDDIDVDGGNYQSSVTVDLAAGQSVVVGVDGYFGEVGPYTLEVTVE